MAKSNDINEYNENIEENIDNINNALVSNNYKWGFKDDAEYEYKENLKLGESLVKNISRIKKEPDWMLELRLKAIKAFFHLELPKWMHNIDINYDDITYYAKPKINSNAKASSWDDVPGYIKNTFEKLGIPEAEKKVLAGVAAQYESEVVYEKVRSDLEKYGVIFCSMDRALKEHENIVKAYFSKLVPFYDNKFAALNTALWSGGSFLYIPENVKIEQPLQAYFRINMQGIGQFERTLIIVEEGGEAQYIEGCSAPVYSKASLHAAVVEVFAKRHSKVRYTTVQNWSKNVYNLVTKRSIAYENAYIEWLDGNIGSKLTAKYPCIILAEPNAKGKIISIAYAGQGQIIDNGAKIIHLAKNTSSNVISKSISSNGGRASYRGLVKVIKGAKKSKVSVNCDALLLDENSKTDTYPNIHIAEKDISIAHEARVGKISDEQLFYLMSRGIDKEQARTLVVMGFLEEFTKELPLEYAVELNRLISLEMEGSVG
ncbi:MAG: Fe-S cluster assembly protein SufB [Candidatus Anstonellales archaeon]